MVSIQSIFLNILLLPITLFTFFTKPLTLIHESPFELLSGIAFWKWIIRSFLLRNRRRRQQQEEKTPSSKVSTLPFYYKDICQDCETKIFEKAKFPRSIVILEPPHLATATTNNNNSNTYFEYPKTLKYAMSHPTSLTLQLFCHLYGIPFSVEQSDELYFLTRNNANQNDLKDVICPVFIKIDDGGATIIKGKDSSHLIEQLFKTLLPFGSQVEEKLRTKPPRNNKDGELSSSCPDSGVEGDDESFVGTSGTPVAAAASSTSNIQQKLSAFELPQCCQMRNRLVSLFRSVGDPLTCGVSGQLSSSDAHRNVNLRRIIDASIAPILEHVLINGISSTSGSSSSSSSLSPSPLEMHNNFLSSSSLSSALKAKIMPYLLKNSLFIGDGGKDSLSSVLDRIVKRLVVHDKSSGSDKQKQTSSSSSKKKKGTEVVDESKNTQPSLLQRIKSFASEVEKLVRFVLLSKLTLRFLQQNNNKSSDSATKYSDIYDELIQTRLKEDLSLLERFISATSSSSSSSSADPTSSSKSAANNNNKNDNSKTGKFLFDCETPTVADCAVLSICLAAVHSEQIEGFYSLKNNTTSSTTTGEGNNDDNNNDNNNKVEKEIKIHALADFVRRRSVKKYMERCMSFFYPGSVVVSNSSNRKKGKDNNNNGDDDENNNDGKKTTDKKRTSSTKKKSSNDKKDTDNADKNNNNKSGDHQKKSSSSSGRKKETRGNNTSNEKSVVVVDCNNNGETSKKKPDHDDNESTGKKRSRSRSRSAAAARTSSSRRSASASVKRSSNLLLQDEQQTKLGEESNHLFGTMTNNNNNHTATIIEEAPDTDAHNDDDDTVLKGGNNNNINSNISKLGSPTLKQQQQKKNISPPASPLLKTILERTNSSLSPRSRREDIMKDNINSDAVVATSSIPTSSSPTTTATDMNATYPPKHHQGSSLSIPNFAQTISQRDLRKLFSGTHLRSPHNKEQSWLKRSGSQVMIKTAARKEWEDSLIRDFNEDPVLSSTSSSQVSSMNVSNQVSAYASPERREQE